MTILIDLLTPKTSRPVIMFGFITSALFGYQNATFRRKMELSTSKEFKIFKKKDLNTPALFAGNQRVVLASSVKMRTVINIIIRNALEKKKFIWNSFTYKK